MGNSWSGIRKILEQDLLCQSLQGRVQYFMTHYHGAPDNYGRFCVRVDGKEVFWANPYNESAFYEYADELQKEKNIPRREWNGKKFLYDEENNQIEDAAAAQMMQEGIMDIWQITDAIQQYRQMDVQTALSSENEAVRMFAILDRRLGKRTLQKQAKVIKEQPEWLQFFYKLRLQAEGMEIV